MLPRFFDAGMPPDPPVQAEAPVGDELHGERDRKEEHQLVEIVRRSSLPMGRRFGQPVSSEDDRAIEEHEDKPRSNLGGQHAEADNA